MIDITCKSCGKRYRVPDDRAGRVGKCSACGARIQVPVPANAEEAEGETAGFGAAISRLSAEKERGKGKVLGKWIGAETETSEVFSANADWRILWAAKGLGISSFCVYVRREGRMKTLALPVNEQNLGGIKEGRAEVDHTGDVYLEIKTNGCERWFVIAQEL